MYRQLKGLGFDCAVVAPSRFPKAPGERIKTGRRDACKLARLSRSGDLTAVWVPDEAQEAMRDLVRALADFKNAERKARHQPGAFLLCPSAQAPIEPLDFQPYLPPSTIRMVLPVRLQFLGGVRSVPPRNSFRECQP